MKRNPLNHPRVFNDSTWAMGYYERNKKNNRKVGKRICRILKQHNFNGIKVLDAGCGFAGVSMQIAKYCPEIHIHAVDLSEPLIDLGNKFVQAQNMQSRIDLSIANVENLSAFPDNSFDCVVSSFVLHIVENPEKMLAELERVCKPEGIIILTDLRRGTLARIAPKLKKSFSYKEFKTCIQHAPIRKGSIGKGPFWSDYISYQPI